jgi:4-methylaminobutanoate oxidase (formaldehyde-forming)
MRWGGELLRRDGVAVGQLTSAAWGESVGSCVGLAWVRPPDGQVATAEFVRSGRYEVDVAGTAYPVTVSLRPPFDPEGRRVQGDYV